MSEKVEYAGLKDPADILYLIKFSPHLRSSYNYVLYTNAEADTWKLETISCQVSSGRSRVQRYGHISRDRF